MNDKLVDVFIGEAAQSFGFLANRYGFNKPTTELDRRSGVVTVTFQKGDLAIEAVCELREKDVEVKVVHLDHGNKPDGYNVDQKGHRCRAGLIEIFIDRGVRAFGLRADLSESIARGKAVDLRLRMRFRRLLDQYAKLLESHGQDILAGSLVVFDTLNAKRHK